MRKGVFEHDFFLVSLQLCAASYRLSVAVFTVCPGFLCMHFIKAREKTS